MVRIKDLNWKYAKMNSFYFSSDKICIIRDRSFPCCHDSNQLVAVSSATVGNWHIVLATKFVVFDWIRVVSCITEQCLFMTTIATLSFSTLDMLTPSTPIISFHFILEIRKIVTVGFLLRIGVASSAKTSRESSSRLSFKAAAKNPQYLNMKMSLNCTTTWSSFCTRSFSSMQPNSN